MPPARRLIITDITEAVCGVCLDARTSLVCDEIHNLNLATRNGAEASPQVLLRAHPGHLRLRRDQRRAGRAAIRHPRRADRRPVRDGPDRAVPPRCPVERPDRRPGIQPAAAPARPWPAPGLDLYLHQRTGGSIGTLLRLIRSAAIQAILDGSQRVTTWTLESIDVDVAAETARRKTGHAR